MIEEAYIWIDNYYIIIRRKGIDVGILPWNF